MATFLKQIQQAEFKTLLRNRFQLVLQSFETGSGRINLFSLLPSFAALLPFKNSLSFAAAHPRQFEFWFEAWLVRASLDLFDQHGELTPALLRVIAPSQEDVQRVRQAGSLFCRDLLLSYCEHFMGAAIKVFAAQHQPALQDWWQARLSALARDPRVFTQWLARQADHQWSHLCMIWRWIQYSTQFCEQDPVRLFRAFQSLYEALTLYLQRTQNLPFEFEKMTVIAERLVNDAGYIYLEPEVARCYTKFYRSFLSLTLEDAWTRLPAKVRRQITKHPAWCEQADIVAALMAQFFMLGVVLTYREDTSINTALLLQEEAFDVRVLSFLKQVPQHYETWPHLKKIVKVNPRETHAALASRIPQTLEHYQALESWLLYQPERFPKLNEVAPEGLQRLYSLDQQLTQFAEILAKMSWLRPADTTALDGADAQWVTAC